jgi:hypothetical protein
MNKSVDSITSYVDDLVSAICLEDVRSIEMCEEMVERKSVRFYIRSDSPLEVCGIDPYLFYAITHQRIRFLEEMASSKTFPDGLTSDVIEYCFKNILRDSDDEKTIVNYISSGNCDGELIVYDVDNHRPMIVPHPRYSPDGIKILLECLLTILGQDSDQTVGHLTSSLYLMYAITTKDYDMFDRFMKISTLTDRTVNQMINRSVSLLDAHTFNQLNVYAKLNQTPIEINLSNISDQTTLTEYVKMERPSLVVVKKQLTPHDSVVRLERLFCHPNQNLRTNVDVKMLEYGDNKHFYADSHQMIVSHKLIIEDYTDEVVERIDLIVPRKMYLTWSYRWHRVREIVAKGQYLVKRIINPNEKIPSIEPSATKLYGKARENNTGLTFYPLSQALLSVTVPTPVTLLRRLFRR